MSLFKYQGKGKKIQSPLKKKKGNNLASFYSLSFADFHSEMCLMNLGPTEISAQHLGHRVLLPSRHLHPGRPIL